MTNSHDHEAGHAVDPPTGQTFWQLVFESDEYGVVQFLTEVPSSVDDLVKVEDEGQLAELFSQDPSPRLAAYAIDRLFIDAELVPTPPAAVGEGTPVPGVDRIQLHQLDVDRTHDAFEVLREILQGFQPHLCPTDNIGPYDDGRPDPPFEHPAWFEHGIHFSSHSHWTPHAEWNSHSHWVEVGNDPAEDYPYPPAGLDQAPPIPVADPSKEIGVIDTGVDQGPLNGKSHPWFPAKVVDGEPEHGREPSDWPSGHGTIVTGVLRKCAPEQGIAVRRVEFDHTSHLAHEFDVILAITRLPSESRVLNLSFGGRFFGCNGPLYRVLHRWARNGGATDGRTIVAAAGNREDRLHRAFVSRPAAFNCAHAVAAGPATTHPADAYRTARVTDPDSYHDWSNGSWGPGVADWVDFIVKVRHNSLQHPPDEMRRIYSTAPLDANGDPRYSSSYGTSVVAPLVTAELARNPPNPDATVDNGHIRGNV